MDRKMNTKLLILLVMMVSKTEAKDCGIEVLSKTDSLCDVKVFCSESTGNMEGIIDDNCRRERLRPHNYDYHYSYNYNYQNYPPRDKRLHIILERMFIGNTEDPLKDIPYKASVRDLEIKNGDIISFPSQIYSMNNIIQIAVTDNALDSINFDKLSKLNNLNSIIISHNSISIIENENFGLLRTSSIEKIDLSYNLIREIPINSFVNCNKLLFLDLSHNLLTSLDILSFEGLQGLQILNLSNNQLAELGVSLARFVNLQEISLDYNQLTTVSNLNFRTLTNLRSLNLSSNLVKYLDDDIFTNLVKLEKIDLSYNKISVLRKKLFERNVNLNTLQLECNFLETIDRGTFENKNITHFYFDKNILTGSIENDTFIGITTSKLDLSGERITSLGLQAFSCLGNHLEVLNLSRNLINHVSRTAFTGLGKLVNLDLSRNLFIDLDFETSDLKLVAEINLSHNRIKYIRNNTFTKMFSVTKIDLSFNEIESIEIGSFSNLEQLNNIILNNNFMEKSIYSNVFHNLNNLRYLHLINTGILSFENYSLSDLPNLKFLNSSFGKLTSIGYETFRGSGATEILDFSFNEIQIFVLNTTNTPKLKELYLNNNKLTNITDTTLANFIELKKINLSSNNLLQIDSSTFQTTKTINTINLSMNVNLTIDGTIFNNLLLSEAYLARTNSINFEHATNVSIKTLDLSFCNINNLNIVHIFNVKDILRVDLSSNMITSLNQKSFQVMYDLNWIDLSSNNISLIEPGTFLHTNSINILDLHSNQLVSLQFGVLDGLTNLRILNLSQNEITNFDPNLLHATPKIKDLILDSNNITSIHINNFKGYDLKTLSIGSNPLNCNEITHLKQLEFNVTAEIKNFHEENINGITCRTSTILDLNDSNNNKYENLTTYNAQYQEKLIKLLDSLNNKTSSNTFTNMQTELSNFTHTIKEIFNSSQISMNKYSNVLYNISDSASKINVLRELLTEYVNSQKEEHENNNKIIKSMLNEIGQYRKETTKVDTTPEKYYNKTDVVISENREEHKTLILYVLTGILAIFLVLKIVKAIYKFFRANKSRANRIELLSMRS